MAGYKIKLILYSEHEIWREVEVPENITFERLHFIIQKLFGFRNYHMWEFRIPYDNPDSDEINLDHIIKTIDMEKSFKLKLNKIFNNYSMLVYEYDFGDSWEIIIFKTEDTSYKNKTALITDYKSKYNPIDDIGGVLIFDEIIEKINDGEDVSSVLDEYGIEKWKLMHMDFEEKYEIGSRIRLNNPERVLTLR